jgi:hypothetical protein
MYLRGRLLHVPALFVREDSSHIKIICFLLFVLRVAPEAASVSFPLAHHWGEIL